MHKHTIKKLKKQNLVISVMPFIYIFIALFPVMPGYFSILGISFNLFLEIMIIIIGIMSPKKLLMVPRSRFGLMLFIWIFWKFFVCVVIHGSLLNWTLNYGLETMSCYIIYKNIDSKDKFFKAVDLIINISGIISILGIVESVTHFNFFNLLNNTNTTLNYNLPRFGFVRIISSQSHAISYGLYCMMVMGLIIYRIQFEKKKNIIKQLKILYAILWVNALLTFSRSSLLCIVLSQFILLVIIKRWEAFVTILKIVIAFTVSLAFVRFFIPQLYNVIKNVLYMMLALFDDNYASMISGYFGVDDVKGYGARLDLYKWVIADLKGHYLFGKGPLAEFNYQFTDGRNGNTWTLIKRGIEVHHLNLMYHYGIITLILEVLANMAIIIEGFKKSKGIFEEEKVKFGTIISAISCGYLLSWFGCSHMSEYKMFVILIALFLAYKRIEPYKNHLTK